jgi:hypothetical protein
MVSKGFEGEVVMSSLLVCSEHNKRLNLPAASGCGDHEWGVFVISLLYICFCEMIVAMGEFDAVEFDIGSGLCGKGIMCLEAFNEKDC